MPLLRRALPVLFALLLSCSGGDGGDPIGPGDGNPDPSAYDLIDADLASGRIDAETALLQKIFAAREDRRLQSRYRGAPRAVPPQLPTLLRQASTMLPELSLAGQRAVVGLFQPPAYQQSGWSTPYDTIAHGTSLRAEDPIPGPTPIPQEGWRFVDAPSIPVRVWIQEDNTTAGITPDMVITLLQNEIYPKLVAAMGREPVPDAGGRTFEMDDGSIATWGDGGNGRFDIYLIEIGGRGTGGAMVLNYPRDCSAAPAFMIVDPTRNVDKLGPVLAHEFFHALQFAFPRTVPCDAKWDEATAEWASHYVYPRWDPKPWTGLLYSPETSIIGMDYVGWLFNAYLQHKHGPDLIRETYVQYARHDEAAKAIDAAVPGGLRAVWPDFAERAFNNDPTGKSFVDWEGLHEVPHRRLDERNAQGDWYVPLPADTFALNGLTKREWTSANPPYALTRKYRIWGVASDEDNTLHWLRFTNKALGRNVSVVAWIKIRGQEWIKEDWSRLSEVQFCRDFASERVDSVITMMSDYTLSDNGWRETPVSKWEARRTCPSGITITVSDRTVNDSHGVVYSVDYSASMDDDHTSTEADLIGLGAYIGEIITRKVNCNNGEPENVRTWPVSGLLDAFGFIGPDPGGPEGARLFGYVLETADWRFLPLLGRYAETPEEIETARGLGTVGSGLRPVQLVGTGNLFRTDTLTRGWATCTGNEYRIRETFVQQSGTSPSPRR